MKVFSSAAHAAEGVEQDVLEILGINRQIEKAHEEALILGGRGTAISGIAADDDGIAVVAGVAPAPDGGFAHDHEGGDLVEGVVHPVGLERGAVAGLMPAGVGGGGIEHAVDRRRGGSPTRCPTER